MLVGGIVTALTAGTASGFASSLVASSGIGSAIGTGAVSAGIKAAITAGITSTASAAAISAINNKGDLGAVIADLTKKDAMKALAISMATAGIAEGVTSAISPKLGIPDAAALKKLEGAQRYAGIAKQVATKTIIKGTVSAAITGKGGKNPGAELLQTTAGAIALASAHNAIGDVGITHNYADGGIMKTAMHGIVGGAFSAATGGKFAHGAIAGGVGEIMPSIINRHGAAEAVDPSSSLRGAEGDAAIHPTPRLRVAGRDDSAAKTWTGLAAATATMLAGGGVKAMVQSQNAAESSIDYNKRLHPNGQKVLAAMQEGKSEEEQNEYEQVAKAKVHAADGVNPEDLWHLVHQKDQEIGTNYLEKHQELDALAVKMGMPNAFEYTAFDRAMDGISANFDEGITRTVGAVKAGLGSKWTIGALKTGVGLAKTNTPLGYVGAAGFGAAALGNAYYAGTGGKELLAPYEHTEGAKVEASFHQAMPSYAMEKGTKIGMDIALGAVAYLGGGAIGAHINYAGSSTKVVGTAATGMAEALKDGEKSFSHAKKGGTNSGSVVKGEKPVGISTNTEAKQLLPGEGKVGSHDDLKKLEKRGDNLTPHHFPQAAYMQKYGVNPKDGIAIMMEHPVPGVGGRHRMTRTYGQKPDFSTTPREELAIEVMDIRTIYKKEGLYNDYIHGQLQEAIQGWKDLRPDLFLKKK